MMCKCTLLALQSCHLFSIVLFVVYLANLSARPYSYSSAKEHKFFFLKTQEELLLIPQKDKTIEVNKKPSSIRLFCTLAPVTET